MLLVFGIAWSLTSYAAPAAALLVGILVALTTGNAVASTTNPLNKGLLKLSVILLGFGVSLGAVVEAGASGVLQISVAVAAASVAGLVVGRLLGVEWTTSWLITIGTAICGGSAIAALGPTIRARADSMSVALGTVFVLNAVALYAFPPIGASLGLSQHQFAAWAAIAIHDTASVVGAADMYGSRALEEATILKLVRTLWIVPIVALAGAWMARREASESASSPLRRGLQAFPWFVLGFLGTAALRTGLPSYAAEFDQLRAIGRQGLVLTLFLIGAGLTRENLRKVGHRPLLQGVALWLLVSVASLLWVRL